MLPQSMDPEMADSPMVGHAKAVTVAVVGHEFHAVWHRRQAGRHQKKVQIGGKKTVGRDLARVPSDIGQGRVGHTVDEGAVQQRWQTVRTLQIVEREQTVRLSVVCDMPQAQTVDPDVMQMRQADAVLVRFTVQRGLGMVFNRRQIAVGIARAAVDQSGQCGGQRDTSGRGAAHGFQHDQMARRVLPACTGTSVMCFHCADQMIGHAGAECAG